MGLHSSIAVRTAYCIKFHSKLGRLTILYLNTYTPSLNMIIFLRSVNISLKKGWLIQLWRPPVLYTYVYLVHITRFFGA